MSLYGPRLRLPKMDIPSPSRPSWNLEKEKKIIVFAIAAIVIIVAILVIAPIIMNTIGSFWENATSPPSIQLAWKNNPLDLQKDSIASAELTISFTNTKKTDQNIYFTLNYPNSELLQFCPDYVLYNVAPEDKRTVTCLFRRNGEIFTGTYSIEIQSNLGNAKTKLEVLAK